MHDLAAAAAFQAAPLLQEEQHLRCPRCDSTNTKFCYYNNYNLSQPRHYCRDCRRYWTRGGALRNVPVGGGTRKSSKRGAPSLSSSTSPSKRPNTLSSSLAPAPAPAPAPAAAAPTATPSASPLQILSIGHVSVLRPTHEGVLSVPGATDLVHPTGSRPSAQLHSLGVFGNISSNTGPPPPRTPVPDTILGLQRDANWWNGGGSGGGWPNLSVYTPGSKLQ